MKPMLHKMPCGDWVPLEDVNAIIVNPARNDEVTSTKAHVNVVLCGGKINLYCVTDSYEKAQEIAADLGEAVNNYRTSGIISYSPPLL